MATATSLLTALNCKGNTHLIVGTNPLAAARCTQSLAAGATTILLAPETPDLHYGLQKRIDAGEVTWHKKAFEDTDLFTLGRDEVDNVVDAVFVTSGPRDALAAHISALCRRNRIPVNVVDAPQLCSFSLLSTHTDGPLQIGVTTNGRGCKLASRIRREVAAALPTDLGAACARLGDVRRRIQTEDHLSTQPDEVDDSFDQTASFNKLVTEADLDAAKSRRMRWLSQVCEYWPLKRLAAINDEDVESVLKSYSGNTLPEAAKPPVAGSGNAVRNSQQQGRIILAGSGPGHPDLLTRATHKAIQTADLILADKLVPAGVLDLIPRRTPVQIARKFPGNADQAQEELHELALAGRPVHLRTWGEEVAYFREHGFGDRVTVLPGITSSLSAPLFAGIPPTQRDVADQVLICTGTGKKGKPPTPPEFIASRTVVFLMALHRITGLVRELTCYLETEGSGTTEGEEEAKKTPKRALWPRNTPCAVIERASCPDQRVIRTTLEYVAEAIETEGSRPPGLLVVGRACEALYEREKGRAWAVEDGFKGFDFEELPGLS
ncbi:siroheme synthase [Colletotrichum tofieldiae]|nr:siroheme synthase [Colletotrichum tofieldiae]